MVDVTHPPRPAQPKPPPPPQTLEPGEQMLQSNPYLTLCSCGRCPYMLPGPLFHCPMCHDTYRRKSLTLPARCAHCQFDYASWMRRNNFTAHPPQFP